MGGVEGDEWVGWEGTGGMRAGCENLFENKRCHITR